MQLDSKGRSALTRKEPTNCSWVASPDPDKRRHRNGLAVNTRDCHGRMANEAVSDGTRRGDQVGKSATPPSGTPGPLRLPSSPRTMCIADTVPARQASPPHSPVLSSSSTDPISPIYRNLTTAQLRSAYGTGPLDPPPKQGTSPLPGLSSYNQPRQPAPTAPPSPSYSDWSTDPEIWEYRGHRLTGSALDLVLREEMLAQADSSGQYAGEVSWDDLRQTWIPKHVQKLKATNLAEGEVPDTTPAGFKVKTVDEWGNRIGWYGPHWEMYYVDEPQWELPDSDKD
ncbi:hypothetical protein IAU60_004421 [Kwoniella sp. DSM 27419]